LKLQITIDGKTYAAEVDVIDEESTGDSAEYAPASAAPRALPAGAYTPSQPGQTHSADEKVYQSPLMGLVIKVNVAPGQEVSSGDVLVVLEAMKMETCITAHHAGKVKTVAVKAGDSVKMHQLLLELE